MQPQNLHPLKLLIVAQPERVRTKIFSLLYMAASVVIVGKVDALAEFPPAIMTGAPEVLVVDGGDLEDLDYDQLTVIRRQQPQLIIVLVATRHRRGVLDKLYRAGVGGFVTEDVGGTVLLDMLYTVNAHPRIFLVRIGG